MLTEYRSQTIRLETLKQYNRVLTNSVYMRRELINHGLPADRVVEIPYYVRPLRHHQTPGRTSHHNTRESWRLAFAGRMVSSKGGKVLLDALPVLRSQNNIPIRVVFAGDGPARSAWETEARRIKHTVSDVGVEFTGWLEESRLATLFRNSDLLVVPSLAPESFGAIGVRAAWERLPSAAFNAGGISEWLIDGVTGHLARTDPPTPQGLAGAILNCLSDPDHHATLRDNAAKLATRFTAEQHLSQLAGELECAISATPNLKLG
jgi:glycosyltransferase involved in cell wall biosynthesis